jgi:hypothetical protein
MSSVYSWAKYLPFLIDSESVVPETPTGAAGFLWETDKRTPRAWSCLIPARYFDDDIIPGGAWYCGPINQEEWNKVFVEWCKRRDIVHESIFAYPDDPSAFALWVEFLEEYPLRREQWARLCEVTNDGK